MSISMLSEEELSFGGKKEIFGTKMDFFKAAFHLLSPENITVSPFLSFNSTFELRWREIKLNRSKQTHTP